MDSNKAIARASPKARAAVVEDVGARSRGHASLVLIIIGISEDFDIDEFLLLVREATFEASLFKEGRMK